MKYILPPVEEVVYYGHGYHGRAKAEVVDDLTG